MLKAKSLNDRVTKQASQSLKYQVAVWLTHQRLANLPIYQKALQLSLTTGLTANHFGEIGKAVGLGRASAARLRAARLPHPPPFSVLTLGRAAREDNVFPQENDPVHPCCSNGKMRQMQTELHANMKTQMNMNQPALLLNV